MGTTPTIEITSRVRDYYDEGRTVIRRYYSVCSCGIRRGADKRDEIIRHSDDHAAWHMGRVHIIDYTEDD